MAPTPFIAITIFLLNVSYSFCVVLARNNTFSQKGFAPALATWYGAETGSGSGAACGWENDVRDPPLSSMIAAGNANIFLNGKGCGHCFQIFCTRPPYCSGNPIKVTISDQCPGLCNAVPFHFDLSGIAFGAMAKPGQGHNLRQLGQVDVSFQRVPCNYGGTKIGFRVDHKCNPYWFAVALEYVDGDGGFRSVEIAPGGTQSFVPMENIWGAVWRRDINPSFQPPFSFRLTSIDGRTIVANNVIPRGFGVGQKYSSLINFN